MQYPGAVHESATILTFVKITNSPHTPILEVEVKVQDRVLAKAARALGTGGIAAEAFGNRREGELLRQILEELKLIKEELKTCEKSRTTN